MTGVYAFSLDAFEGDPTLHRLMFAPAAGVDEDPVTGTTSGAVGAYLREVRAFDGELPEEMVFEQRHFVDRPDSREAGGLHNPQRSFPNGSQPSPNLPSVGDMAYLNWPVRR